MADFLKNMGEESLAQRWLAGDRGTEEGWQDCLLLFNPLHGLQSFFAKSSVEDPSLVFVEKGVENVTHLFDVEHPPERVALGAELVDHWVVTFMVSPCPACPPARCM